MDLMSLCQSILNQTAPKIARKALSLAFIALATGWTIGRVYASLQDHPANLAKLNGRVATLELSNASTCTQLAGINTSLARIELNEEANRQSLDQLKNVLILKK